MASCRLRCRPWSPLAILCLASVWSFLSMAKSEASDIRRKYCDEWHLFEPAEDQNFVEMLDNLLEDSKTSFSGAVVTAKDGEGRFEGQAGCLWHNCQIYDGECYGCHNTKDAAVCIETLVAEIKQSVQGRNRYKVDGYCQRTREFGTGERSVAVDDTSTTFQVCGVRYRYLG